MKKRKHIISGLLLLIAAASGFGYYWYNKKPADTRTQTAFMELTAEKLLSEFRQDEAAATTRYADRLLIVSGKLRMVETDTAGQATAYLDAGDPLSSVICSFYIDESGKVQKIAPGTIVRVKGICTGMLTDVILNRCSMVH